jgi:hypothetical protein
VPSRAQPLGGLSVLLAAALAGCSSQTTGTLQIITGEETDTFTRDPVPVSLEVDSIDSSGNTTKLATASLPATTIDLGTIDQTTVATLALTGTDAANARVVYGQSVVWEFGGLDGLTAPLFVQRTGDLARLPNPLSDSRSPPLLAVFEGRYLLVAAGADDPALRLRVLRAGGRPSDAAARAEVRRVLGDGRRLHQ